MSENTPHPVAPQQPQFAQQAPAVQPASGPVEAPKKKKWAAVTALVLGIISALTGIFVIGSFLTIPTIIFAVIALVMVKNGTGKGKGMAIAVSCWFWWHILRPLLSSRFVRRTLRSLTERLVRLSRSAKTTSPAITLLRRTVSVTVTLAAGSTRWISKPALSS